MNSGYYAACAGLRAQTEALELVANNLANLSTTGFRGQLPTFRSLLAGAPAVGLSPLNYAINNFNVLGETRIDQSAGNLEQTGNALDVAIEGGGFLVVATPAGTRYTRNGSLKLSAKGLLTTQTDDSVLGDQGPITVPSGIPAIGADGTLSVNGAVVDKLRVVEFAPASPPISEGNSYYSAPVGASHPATGSNLRQAMLETANVNSVTAAVTMIAVQRHFEMLQGALSAFYTTFNRIAADELPRLS